MKDFVNDAFHHYKFVGYAEPAETVFDIAGIEPDGGFLALSGKKDVKAMLETCAELRYWDRGVFTD